MGITSLEYIAFFTVVCLIYYCIPKKARWPYLMICSIGYMLVSGNPILVLYPLCSVFATWIFTNRMSGAEQKKRKLYLVLAIASNLGILIVLKYLNLGIYTYNAICSRVGADTGLVEAFRFATPIGVSFYTMSVMGYIFDVYYEIGEAEKNYFKLLLFAVYFPLMISGPIVKYREMRTSFFEAHRADYKNITYGIWRIIWGFFKVLVLAERFAIVTATVFDNFEDYRGTYVFVAAICYTLQLYTNFSGSMDIIMGVSQMLGIILPENFRQPFFAETIQEFWQRWHITLGVWLREYVMYPVLRTDTFIKLPKKLTERFGKKKAKQYTTFLAMGITWMIVGLWHGGAWKYIWGSGILQCAYIITGELLTPAFKTLYEKIGVDYKNRGLKLFRKVRTFLLMSFSLIFFNASSMTDGFKMVRNMFSAWNPWIMLDGSLLGMGLNMVDWAVVFGGMILLWAISMLQREKSICERLANINIVSRWAILYCVILFIVIFGNYGPGYSAAEFIYQGF